MKKREINSHLEGEYAVSPCQNHVTVRTISYITFVLFWVPVSTKRVLGRQRQKVINTQRVRLPLHASKVDALCRANVTFALFPYSIVYERGTAIACTCIVYG